ncbi:DUF4352 domain-containing protein [Catellatospora citrea]|uniref:DUF4352 domain-containing protein n=1 Tax=Catellatospora citrea TaxID=53366 RepID=A0A8J3KCP4_9ACTN|nr:DUF4352 domain-containing protein [Catellatospora citrea]RKE05913.1 uncharacterized protein DUF4352 [Catellatospora citrea]GIF97576.1 hypothetical protein Cci01nite_26700 [Catellatospora citrea]
MSRSLRPIIAVGLAVVILLGRFWLRNSFDDVDATPPESTITLDLPVPVPLPELVPMPSLTALPPPRTMSPPAPASASLGGRLEVTTPVGDRVRLVVKSVTTGVKSTNPYGVDKNGTGYAVVKVEFTCLAVRGGTRGCTANPLSFRVVGADGVVYPSVIRAGMAEADQLSLTPMQDGQTQSGSIVFDVSKAAMAGARIEYIDIAKWPLAVWVQS